MIGQLPYGKKVAVMALRRRFVPPGRLCPKGWVAIGLLASLANCSAPKPPAEFHITVETDGDFLAFKPDVLSVPTGAIVVVTFHHAGHIISQKHDLVVADKGTMPALLAQGNRMAASGVDEDKSVIAPGDKRVLAASNRIDKGQTTTLRFVAPAPGDYPFFCSTPGHGDTMRGVLHVTPI